MSKGLILKKKKREKLKMGPKIKFYSQATTGETQGKKKMNKGKPNFSTAQLQEISETLQMFQVLRLASPRAPQKIYPNFISKKLGMNPQ